jgi:hypothetical protein
MICPYCHCDPEKDNLKEAIKKLKGCNNCLVDIELRGEWTGKGIAAIKALAAKHGTVFVANLWEAK